jgi:hypothetical protein
MTSRRLVVLAGLVFAGAIVLVRAIPAAPAGAEDKEGDAKSLRDLVLRYADAQHKLAETNLKKVEVTNQRFARTVSASVIADYTEDLAIAKDQLDGVRRDGEQGVFEGWLRRVESNLKTAEASYNSARVANQRQPGTVDVLDLERTRLRVEIAKVQFEQGKLLVNAPVQQRLLWQVQVLNDEVVSLKVQTSRIAPQTRVYPWRY